MRLRSVGYADNDVADSGEVDGRYSLAGGVISCPIGYQECRGDGQGRVETDSRRSTSLSRRCKVHVCSGSVLGTKRIQVRLQGVNSLKLQDEAIGTT